MLCRLGNDGRELEVPLAHAEIGSRIRIAIRAGDIIIATERPHALSARNTFEGRVVEIKREGMKSDRKRGRGRTVRGPHHSGRTAKNYSSNQARWSGSL